MITAPTVLDRLVTLLTARPELAGGVVPRGVPEKAADTGGSDSDLRFGIFFGDIRGELPISEVCGPDRTVYDETYELDVVCQVLGRNRTADFAAIEEKRADLIWALIGVTQDATLGIASTGRIGRIEVTVGAAELERGWLALAGSAVRACKADVTLTVETQLTYT